MLHATIRFDPSPPGLQEQAGGRKRGAMLPIRERLLVGTAQALMQRAPLSCATQAKTRTLSVLMKDP